MLIAEKFPKSSFGLKLAEIFPLLEPVPAKLVRFEKSFEEQLNDNEDEDVAAVVVVVAAVVVEIGELEVAEDEEVVDRAPVLEKVTKL